MRRVKLIIFFLFLWLSEILIKDCFSIFSVKTDLFIPALVNLGLNYSLREVLGFGFFLGFLQDIGESYPLGINSLIFLSLGGLIYKINNSFVIETFASKLLLVIFGVLMLNILKSIFFYLGGFTASIFFFFKNTAFSLLYTTALSIIVFKTMDFLCR